MTLCSSAAEAFEGIQKLNTRFDEQFPFAGIVGLHQASGMLLEIVSNLNTLKEHFDHTCPRDMRTLESHVMRTVANGIFLTYCLSDKISKREALTMLFGMQAQLRARESFNLDAHLIAIEWRRIAAKVRQMRD